MKAFTAPDGVQVMRIDRATDLPADSTCPSDGMTIAFLVGTAPQGTCSQMGMDSQTLANQMFNPQAAPNSPGNPNAPGNPNNPANPNATPEDGTKHRNFFQKMFGIGKDKQQNQQQNQQQEPASPQD